MIRRLRRASFGHMADMLSAYGVPHRRQRSGQQAVEDDLPLDDQVEIRLAQVRRQMAPNRCDQTAHDRQAGAYLIVAHGDVAERTDAPQRSGMVRDVAKC